MLSRTHVIILMSGCNKSINGEVIFVEPDLDDLFNYPYFLFIANGVSEDKMNYLIIEPNNSGFADDDLHKHKEKAKRIATLDYYLGNWIARKLTYPLIVPVFPRMFILTQKWFFVKFGAKTQFLNRLKK